MLRSEESNYCPLQSSICIRAKRKIEQYRLHDHLLAFGVGVLEVCRRSLVSIVMQQAGELHQRVVQFLTDRQPAGYDLHWAAHVPESPAPTIKTLRINEVIFSTFPSTPYDQNLVTLSSKVETGVKECPEPQQ